MYSDIENIRKEAKKQRASLDTEKVLKDGRAIFSKVTASPEFINADKIYCYCSYKNEVSTVGIIERALSMGKQVAVPKVEGSAMSFFDICDIAQLKAGYMGIPEPDESSGICAVGESKNEIMIVPGVAFDISCNRIGQGKGYYDRYLSINKVYKCAIAYDFQIYESIPAREYDIRMDVIYTPTRIITDKTTYSHS